MPVLAKLTDPTGLLFAPSHLLCSSPCFRSLSGRPRSEASLARACSRGLGKFFRISHQPPSLPTTADTHPSIQSSHPALLSSPTSPAAHAHTHAQPTAYLISLSPPATKRRRTSHANLLVSRGSIISSIPNASAVRNGERIASSVAVSLTRSVLRSAGEGAWSSSALNAAVVAGQRDLLEGAKNGPSTPP